MTNYMPLPDKDNIQESEDIKKLKLNSKLTTDIVFYELVMQENCEQIRSKWVLLEESVK